MRTCQKFLTENKLVLTYNSVTMYLVLRWTSDQSFGYPVQNINEWVGDVI